MEKIRMEDIIPLLPLPYPPQGRSSYYVACPQCDRSGRRKDKHLNISLSKDVFRCPKCGWNGGVFDLYAYYTSTPRDKVRDELIRILRKEDSDSGRKQRATAERTAKPETYESPSAGIEIRHAAYNTLLSLLTLAPDHTKNLLERGLTERVITENGYRTTPVVGGRALAKQIQQAGISLSGVPGFYIDNSGQWTFIAMWRGILIPVRDIEGRIQGLQVRRDNAEKRKYRWVSSGDIKNGTDGCGAEGWIHIAGTVRESVLLIEGPLKADIVHHLTGQTVVAVPGVNSLKHLQSALTELARLGVNRLMTAFDMDFLKNPHVQNGYNELVEMLGSLDIRYGTYLWRPDYNGLDDYIWECCINHKGSI